MSRRIVPEFRAVEAALTLDALREESITSKVATAAYEELQRAIRKAGYRAEYDGVRTKVHLERTGRIKPR